MRIFAFFKKRRFARLLLLGESVIISVFLTIFLIQYFETRGIDPVYANSYYSTHAEYIIGSFAIAIASAILVDVLEQET